MWCDFPGKLYVKKGLWDLAEKELQCAEQILKDSNKTLCCSKCKLILEVTLYEYLGDLCQSKFDTCKEVISEETVKNWYTSALDKLVISEWKNPLSCPKDSSDASAADVKCVAGNTCTCFIMDEVDESVMKSMKVGPETKIGSKQNRKTKNAEQVLPKEPNIVVENKSRLTRSRYRSSQNQHTSISRKSEVSESVEGNQVSGPSEMLCWHCLPSKVVKSGLLNDFINFKWEFVRRRLSMKLLTRVGMCAIFFACKCEHCTWCFLICFKIFCVYMTLFFFSKVSLFIIAFHKF